MADIDLVQKVAECIDDNNDEYSNEEYLEQLKGIRDDLDIRIHLVEKDLENQDLTDNEE